jgi:hypothetical protein
MKGAYPPERQRVWVWGEYELRYINPSKETEGYHPLWINRHFLEHADYHQDNLVVGDAQFSMLYVDVKYMDLRSLKRILELAKKGLPVCLKQLPKQPGKIKSTEYAIILKELSGMQSVASDFQKVIGHPPFLAGDSLPDYWCRWENDGTYYIFLAQPLSKDLAYPIYSGQSIMKQSIFRDLTINVGPHVIRKRFEFRPYQSLLLRITPDGTMEEMDIGFVPKDPVVRPREVQKTYF